MAEKDISPDSLAKKAFIFTMLGALLYISVVFIFVIGGNKKLDADHAAKTPAAHATSQEAVHP